MRRLDRHRRPDAELPEPPRAVRDDDGVEDHHTKQAHNTASIHPFVARAFDRVEQARADDDRGLRPASMLLYLTTHCSECHLSTLRSCWPNTLRRSPLLGTADVLLYSGCNQLAAGVASWAHALAALPVNNATLAWTRWNPGLQEGALSAVMIAARRGWFERYDWIVERTQTCASKTRRFSRLKCKGRRRYSSDAVPATRRIPQFARTSLPPGRM